MSKYAKPKRNVQKFNVLNFEKELVKSTTDVLKITKNEIETQTTNLTAFYNIGENNFTSGSINGFIQITLSKKCLTKYAFY